MSNKEKDNPPQKRFLPKATRLIFEYEGESIRLIEQQNVDMIIPTAPNSVPSKQKGFWIEVKDHKSKVLFSKTQQNPIRQDVEVFSDKSGENIVRRPALHAKGTFVVLIPNLPEASSIDLLTMPTEKKTREPVKKLATFSLKEKHSKKEEKT